MKKIIMILTIFAALCLTMFVGCERRESTGQTEINRVYEMPRALVFKSSGGEISPYNSVILHATVSPNNATVKDVDWSASFVSSSGWASGKSVSDYVTVTPETDGSATATVACLQPFGEQVKVTVTSRSNPSAKAYCTVDFVKKIDYITVIGEINPVNLTLNYQTNPSMLNSQMFTPTVYYTDFTIDDEYEHKYYVKFSQAFLNKLKEHYPEIRFQDSLSYVSDTYWSEYHETAAVAFYFDTVVSIPLGGMFNAGSYTGYSDTVKNILAGDPSLGYFATYKAKYTGTNTVFEYEVPVRFDVSTFNFNVAEVTLSETQIII